MEATRNWIEDAIDQEDDIFVVIGYHTMLDAHITEGNAAGTKASGRVKMPVTESLAAAGIVIPLGDVLNPGISGGDQHSQNVQRQFVATGEQVCAVRYRKLRFKWFSSRDLDSASLDKENRWKVVDLEDDFEVDQDHGKYTSEGGDAFLL